MPACPARPALRRSQHPPTGDFAVNAPLTAAIGNAPTGLFNPGRQLRDRKLGQLQPMDKALA